MGLTAYAGVLAGNTFPLLTINGAMITTGNVFFASSTAALGSDNNAGNRTDLPMATLDAAIGRCTANNGDFIFVAPNHVETVSAAAGLVLDVAGISIIGLGHGSNRPQINFTTVVGADVDVDAADILMANFLFTGGIDALTGPIDINAADFRLVNFETRDVTGQATDFIVTDANADNLKIKDWRHRGAAGAGADTAITIVGGDDIEVDDFDIDGNFAVSCIENVTTAAVNLRIGVASTRHVNAMRTRNSADTLVTLVTTTTGFVDNLFGRLQDNAANITEAFVGADMQFGNNLYLVNNDGEGALQWNGTKSTDA